MLGIQSRSNMLVSWQPFALYGHSLFCGNRDVPSNSARPVNILTRSMLTELTCEGLARPGTVLSVHKRMLQNLIFHN